MLGVIFALIALLSWGFGDFFIQRATRVVGVWKALFFIGIVGIIVLSPFVLGEIGEFLRDTKAVLLLTFAGVVMFFAAIFDFTALKQGKIAIVEPILGIELPVTVGLSVFLWGENLSPPQIFLIFAIFIGIVLAVTIHHRHLHYHRRIFERGVLLAGVGAITMGLVNFLIGVSSQIKSPFLTIF